MEQHVRADQPISIEFVSTLHADSSGLVDTLESSAQLADWLGLNRERLPQGLDRSSLWLGELRAFRDVLREVFRARVAGEHPGTVTLEALNRAGRLAPAHLELHWSGATPSRVVDSAGPSPDRLVGALARDAIEVVAGHGHGDLRSCEGPGCVLFFVRTHPRQAWCSPGCGNRARVARHYRKVRAGRRADPS